MLPTLVGFLFVGNKTQLEKVFFKRAFEEKLGQTVVALFAFFCNSTCVSVCVYVCMHVLLRVPVYFSVKATGFKSHVAVALSASRSMSIYHSVVFLGNICSLKINILFVFVFSFFNNNFVTIFIFFSNSKP